MADHLDRAAAGLRLGRRVAREDGARRRLGVEHVVLAVAPARAAVGPIDLEDAVPVLAQSAGEACAGGAGPLDAESRDRAQ
nr:hypothetical protein [Siccirubricoccus phaeus]